MLPQILRQALRANKAGNIVYLNNPKVGCSTVKTALWKALSPETAQGQIDVHTIKGSPFMDDIEILDWLENARIFTFVRNPFVRLVSAYLNKIVCQEAAQWQPFVRRYKVPDDKVLPFDNFVQLISEDAPEDLDPHWRPQHINLMYPFIRPNAIGKLEHMDEELPVILKRFLSVPLAPVQRKNQHGTNAEATYLQYFRNPNTLRRAITLYYNDFCYFNYSLDLDSPQEGRALAAHSDHGHPRLATLAALRKEGSPAARHAALDRIDRLIADDPLTRNDEASRAWAIYARLNSGGRDPEADLMLIRDSIGRILKGPEYLRRSAGQIAASQGAWQLCIRIAGAAQ